MVKVNIFGFDRISSNYSYEDYRHCIFHRGTRLIESKNDPSVVYCPSCGCEKPIKIKDTAPEEEIHTMFGPSSSSSKIVQGRKRKKKQIADDGNEVLDNDLFPFHVLSYNEYKTGEQDKPVVVKK